ncbi:hypothetical protein Kpol_505p5 [Vanderwaltozyma polyspora DSM 70294]|uniref:Amino acid transporter transmembrane domain-containing protein n=1 Tax=Vanderwaltozyma polyspora (strain ATCC 22028 / DSM 70294 / BCRC 21397 / CBS 2163 / NBRC 10782 / NRRL Y-8283 / UCD 57-17) TaxID=436907 RepID=A7TN97_VANPO|nr:uncharacterized protein Kpol_505p5 [Vanderwaltozyma polyspora DSM 70294]EDO16229.1 hypothetical protein Kpol_505p5 [Vanderwaltozyma polyspora DSM 70294]
MNDNSKKKSKLYAIKFKFSRKLKYEVSDDLDPIVPDESLKFYNHVQGDCVGHIESAALNPIVFPNEEELDYNRTENMFKQMYHKIYQLSHGRDPSNINQNLSEGYLNWLKDPTNCDLVCKKFSTSDSDTDETSDFETSQFDEKVKQSLEEYRKSEIRKQLIKEGNFKEVEKSWNPVKMGSRAVNHLKLKIIDDEADLKVLQEKGSFGIASNHFITVNYSDNKYFQATEIISVSDEKSVYTNNASLINANKSLQNSESNYQIEQVSNDKEQKTSTLKSFLLLLKSFVGTGVLFLPSAFHNGGLFFSIVMIMFFGVYSFWCYYLLVRVKTITGLTSFGNMGQRVFGPWMKFIILLSLILSQLGFGSTYVIFTAKNFKAFIENVTNIKDFNIIYPILLQFIIFVPLSYIRRVSKLTLPSLIANGFILIGLSLVIYFSIDHLAGDLHGKPADGIISFFNTKHWTLFIGTAIFAFEGIGLIIPLQNSMRDPSKFPLVLGLVMICTTVMFIIIATIGYLSYGSSTETIILQNFPQKNIVVNLIQLFYALAILLSTPLQIFPAIEIVEDKIFPKPGSDPECKDEIPITTIYNANSGGLDWRIKWFKNMIRTMIVTCVILLAYFGSNNLDKLVAIIGSLACIPLVYMYPPMLHLKTYSIPMSKGKRFTWSKSFDYILIVFGGVSMVYTTYQSIKD